MSDHPADVQLDIPVGYLPLPDARHPWFLLPVDDSGPFVYFVEYLFSSRHAGRRWLILALRVAARLGIYRLWPWIAPRLVMKGSKEES